MTLRTIHVGAGGRGRWPLNRFQERSDFQAVALVDVSAENLAQARQIANLDEAACFSSLGAALQAVEADAVVVITPPDLHAEQCWRPRVHHSGTDDHAYLWERGIHDFDQLRHLLDAEPKRLFCHSFNPPWSPYKGGGAIDGWIEFDNGTTFNFQCTFATHKSGSSWRLDCEKGTVEEVADGLSLRRPGAEADEIIAMDENPHPEETLLDGFYGYVSKGVEPAFSGRNNLKTVGLINALGASSDQGAVIDFDAYMDTH